jgi:hypothetical protein
MTTRRRGGTATRDEVSSLMLGQREIDKLVIYQVTELARRRPARDLKLNFPEGSRRLAARADGPRVRRWSAPRYEHLGPVRLPRTVES